MIDVAFKNLNILPFSRGEYDQALCGDTQAWQIMERTGDLSPSYCGMFWHDFIEDHHRCMRAAGVRLFCTGIGGCITGGGGVMATPRSLERRKT